MEEPTRTIPSSYRAGPRAIGPRQLAIGPRANAHRAVGPRAVAHRASDHRALGISRSRIGHRASRIGHRAIASSRVSNRKHALSLLRKSHVTGGAIGYINYIKGHSLYMGIEHSKISKLSDMCRNVDIKGVIGNLMNFSQT